MPSFNLVTEKWIPCVTDKGTAEEFSLFGVLTQTDRIKELSDDSPFVTVALYRLLLAILHRVFGPASLDDWKELWRQGKWDEVKLKAYFERWKRRFDLFDKERPFYQFPRLVKEVVVKTRNKKATDLPETEETKVESIELLPIATLIQEAAVATNATLFDHRMDAFPEALKPPEAARYLVARQGYSISEGRGYAESFGADGYTVLVKGKNLFETLALNLVPYDEEKPIPHQKEKDISKDKPVWEQDGHKQADEKGEAPAFGYLDYLTWQSRKIHLVVEEKGSLVTHCQRARNLKPSPQQEIFDPLKSYEKNEKKGWVAKRINKERALWRDSHTLLEEARNPTDGQNKRPDVFNHLARITSAQKRGEIIADSKYDFTVYGMNNVNGQASFDLWIREQLPLPLNYLTSPDLVPKLRQAIEVAEWIEGRSPAGGLRAAIKKLSLALVSDKEWSDLAKSFGAEEMYWSSLNAPFKKLLEDLVADERYDEDDEVTRYGENELPKWAKFVEQQARKALERTINSLCGTARDLKAASFAEAEFNKQMGAVKRKFPNLFPKGENE